MIRRRYLIMFVMFSLLVLGKFHGSSIGIWDDMDMLRRSAETGSQ